MPKMFLVFSWMVKQFSKMVISIQISTNSAKKKKKKSLLCSLCFKIWNFKLFVLVALGWGRIEYEEGPQGGEFPPASWPCTKPLPHFLPFDYKSTMILQGGCDYFYFIKQGSKTHRQKGYWLIPNT